MSEVERGQMVEVPVSDVMTHDVLTVRPEQPVEAAVSLIVEHRITGVPVVDAEQRCVGIVSESDVLSRRGRTIAEVMTPDVITVEEEHSLAEAAETMLTRRIRRLPVTRDGRLVGILTRMDLLRHFGQTHWACQWCGHTERGLRPPNACPSCGGETWRFSVEAR